MFVFILKGSLAEKKVEKQDHPKMTPPLLNWGETAKRPNGQIGPPESLQV